MTFKSALEIDCGIRYMFESLEIISPCGRKMLLGSEMMTAKREVDYYYSKLNEIYYKDCSRIANKLMCLKDIQTTLTRLDEGAVLDDIELFEVKYLAIVSQEVLKLLEELRIKAVRLPDVGISNGCSSLWTRSARSRLKSHSTAKRRQAKKSASKRHQIRTEA